MPGKRLKIGYLMQADSVPMDLVSGPQLHVRAVVRGLQGRGHDVRTVALQQNRTQWSDDLVSWHPATFDLSESRPFRLFESALRGIQSRLRLPFIRLFDSLRYSDACVAALAGYDALYERGGVLSYGGLIAARRLRIPLVMELNGDLLKEYHDLGIRLSKSQWVAINRITKSMYHRADRVVTVSETLRGRLIRGWRLDPTKVVTVPNGADIETFLNPRNVEGVRSRYGIGEGPIIILVCCFEPWHAVDLVLDAFARLAPRNSKPNLVLVGDGRLRPFMERKAADLGIGQRVIFTGKVEQAEVASLLAIAHVAVVYHRGSEADTALSPLKLFEYMAAGKAIAAAAAPSIERVITHRVTGLLVPTGNHAALASALAEMLQDDQMRAALGHAARQQAIEKHSWAKTVSEVETVLQDARASSEPKRVGKVRV